MSDLVNRLRRQLTMSMFATKDDLYGQLHDERGQAADRLDQLERVLAQALATLKDGDMDMVHATIAAIDEALSVRVHPPPQAVWCNGGGGRLVNEGTEGNEQWTR